jgi:hypothetical protein
MEKHNTGLYDALKGQAYALASSVTGETHSDAQRKGYKDLWDLIMSDSDHPRQLAFLMALPSVLSEKQRQVLLDELAREYASCDGWVEYVERES